MVGSEVRQSITRAIARKTARTIVSIDPFSATQLVLFGTVLVHDEKPHGASDVGHDLGAPPQSGFGVADVDEIIFARQ